MLPFNAKSFLWTVANDTTTTENCKKYHWLETAAFFLSAKFCQKVKLKILENSKTKWCLERFLIAQRMKN